MFTDAGVPCKEESPFSVTDPRTWGPAITAATAIAIAQQIGKLGKVKLP